MDEEKKTFKLNHIFKLFLIAVLIFSAMFLCALLGFGLVKSSQGDKNDNENTLRTSETEPVYVNEPIDVYEDESLSENITPPSNHNDYLVILEDGAIKLYLIEPDGEIVFSKNLDIPPNSLLKEDIELLKEGIILKSEAELFSLLEDFTS